MNYVKSDTFKESQCNYTDRHGLNIQSKVMNFTKWEFFSQLKEDRIYLMEYFWTKEMGVLWNGIFLEVGALDGISFSNTASFEKNLNWTGVLIGGCPSSAQALISNRPGAIKVLKAVCPADNKNRSIEFTIPCGPTSGVAGKI